MEMADDADFATTLRKEMRARGLSFRGLAERTREKDLKTARGLHHTFLNDIVRGKAAASVESMELIAEALEIPPCRFAEYRLAMVRHAFDEHEVGLARAVRNADALREWITPHERRGLGRELARALDCTEQARPAAESEPPTSGETARAPRSRRPRKTFTDDPDRPN